MCYEMTIQNLDSRPGGGNKPRRDLLDAREHAGQVPGRIPQDHRHQRFLRRRGDERDRPLVKRGSELAVQHSHLVLVVSGASHR